MLFLILKNVVLFWLGNTFLMNLFQRCFYGYKIEIYGKINILNLMLFIII